MRFFILPLLWAIIILGLTLTPGNYFPKMGYWELFSLDKYIHFSIFMIQVCLLLYAEKKTRAILSLSRYIFYFFLAAFFGVVIEFIQKFIPERSYDINDMAANAVGCLIGTAIFYLFASVLNGKYNNSDIFSR